MAREPTPGLLQRLVDAALTAFISAGYQRARVLEIARAAGIAPGTVYLYVEGKEALFELALRYAFLVPGTLDVPLPYRTTDGSGHVEEIWQLLLSTDPLALLDEVEAVEGPAQPAAEFEALVGGIYRWQAKYWRGIALIEACARDWPDLYVLFYQQFRRTALERGGLHLARRAATGHYHRFQDPRVAAHLIMENIAAFSMARHLAPDAEDIPDEVAERTVIEVLGRAFVPGWDEQTTTEES